MLTNPLLIPALLASQALAHGQMDLLRLAGKEYGGYKRGVTFQGTSIGWAQNIVNEGPVEDASNPNMACRPGSAPPKASGSIAAGGKIEFHWNSDPCCSEGGVWAASHHGPVLTYIAPCPGGDCNKLTAASLKWTKIAESGHVSGQVNQYGTWATDVLRTNKGWNSATIPSSIAPGNYVVRNELIALHKSNEENPEFYMQCASITVTGSGTDTLEGSGVSATELYSKSRDTSIYKFTLYNPNPASGWKIPGPPLYKGSSSNPGQGEENPVDTKPTSSTSSKSPEPTEREGEGENEPQASIPKGNGNDKNGKVVTVTRKNGRQRPTDRPRANARQLRA